MAKMSFTDRQRAFEYATYMIAASYFNKTVCKTKMLETNLLVQFKEQKTDMQVRMEDMVIRFMDDLEKKLPGDFFKKEVTARFFRKSANSPMEILFAGEGVSLRFMVSTLDKKFKINCSVWKEQKDGRLLAMAA